MIRNFLLPLLLVLAAAPALAATATLNLKDAEINTLISTVSEITGKNFIVDARVKGKVTVISAKPMTPAGIYETFLGVLQVNGFAAVPDGAAIKIVPDNNARTDGGIRTSDGRGLPIDDVVTHVFTLENVSASQMVPILRPLMPQMAHLAAYTPGNQLIISDRAANVQRMGKLLQQMDQGGDRNIELVRLNNASAAEVVRTLTALAQQDKTQDPSARPALIIADERSNSVLIGGDKGERAKLLEILERLDQPLKDSGTTQVVYLRYASAESLAPILQGYAQAAQTRPSGGAPGSAPVTAAPSGGGNSEVHVLADKDTNALIITAAPKTMRQVRDVIAQLDIQRRQVLVEAMVAEISADKSSQLGVDWAVFREDRIAAAGILNPDTLAALSGVATAGSGALLGLIGQGVTIGGGGRDSSGTSFAVILKALQGDGDSNVLSMPTLATLDNQEAKFSAGQEVPFLTGSFSNTGGNNNGSVNPFQTIERRDVGLTLGVTPQINEGNHIKLKLNLEVSALAANSNSLNPTTTKRTLTNTVGVENGQILVIGGLIDDQLQDTQNKVPVFGDIPVLGNLFRYRSVSKTKRNLMLFIRPSILSTVADGDYYTRRKYESVRQAQIDAGQGPVPLIGGAHPLLPTMEQQNLNRPPAPPTPPASVLANPPETAPSVTPQEPAPAAEAP